MIDMFDVSYDNRFYFYCIKHCYFLILKNYGLEYASLYLYADLDLHVQFHCYDAYGYSVAMNYTPLIKTYIHQAVDGLSYSNEEIYEKFSEKLEEGRPCVCAVDGYYLSYHPDYLKEHEKHSVILCGIDRTVAYVDIIDHFPPYFFRGRLPLYVFDNAFLSEWSYLKKDGWDACPESLIIETLLQAYNQFFIVGHSGILFGRYGLNFLKTMACLLQRYRMEIPGILNHFQREIAKYISKLKFFSFYLEKAVALTRTKRLRELQEYLHEDLRLWNLASIYLVKNLYANSKNLLFADYIRQIYLRMKKFEEIMRRAIQCFR